MLIKSLRRLTDVLGRISPEHYVTIKSPPYKSQILNSYFFKFNHQQIKGQGPQGSNKNATGSSTTAHFQTTSPVLTSHFCSRPLWEYLTARQKCLQLGHTALVRNRGTRFGLSSCAQLQGHFEFPGSYTVTSRVLRPGITTDDRGEAEGFSTNMKFRHRRFRIFWEVRGTFVHERTCREDEIMPSRKSATKSCFKIKTFNKW